MKGIKRKDDRKLESERMFTKEGKTRGTSSHSWEVKYRCIKIALLEWNGIGDKYLETLRVLKNNYIIKHKFMLCSKKIRIILRRQQLY